MVLKAPFSTGLHWLHEVEVPCSGKVVQPFLAVNMQLVDLHIGCSAHVSHMHVCTTISKYDVKVIVISC